MARRTTSMNDEMETRDVKDYDIPLDEGLARYQQASARALERVLGEHGLEPISHRPVLPNQQVFDGRLPPNWSSLDNRQIGELFEMLTAHADFVNTLVTYAKAERSNAEERLKLVKAKVRRSKLGTNDEKDDATLCDGRYVEANAQWLEASEYFEVLNGMLDAAGRDLRILSRHLETKKMEFGGGRGFGGGGGGGRGDPFGRR